MRLKKKTGKSEAGRVGHEREVEMSSAHQLEIVSPNNISGQPDC